MLATAHAYGLTFSFLAGDTVIGPALRDNGEFARPEVELIADYLQDGGDFLDIGGNIGSICLPLARRFPACRVQTVEAAPILAEVLRGNAEANGLANVTVLNAVAAAAPGELEFPHPGDGASGNIGALAVDTPFSRKARLRSVTVDELATPTTRFIKIDVEGFETEVLAGASRTLAEIKPILLAEANPDRGDSSVIARVLMDAGYRCFWFFAPHVTPAAARPGQVAQKGDTNIVALPPGVANLWSLTELTDPTQKRPTGLNHYAYLRRYGF